MNNLFSHHNMTIRTFFCCICILFLAACGSTNTLAAKSPTATKQPTTLKKTPQVSAAITSPQAQCPTTDTKHGITMPALPAQGKRDQVFIYQHGPTFERYDATTKKTTNIITFAKGELIQMPALSPDGQWLVYFTANAPGEGPDQLQIVRIDGRYLQTLWCGLQDAFSAGLRWSPDQHYISFFGGWSENITGSFQLLDLKSGTTRQLLSETEISYTMEAWQDNTHIYVKGIPRVHKLASTTNTNQQIASTYTQHTVTHSALASVAAGPINTQTSLYLLDITQGNNQTTTAFHWVADHFGATYVSVRNTADVFYFSCDPKTCTIYQQNGDADKQSVFQTTTSIIIDMVMRPDKRLQFTTCKLRSMGDLSDSDLCTDQHDTWIINMDGSGLQQIQQGILRWSGRGLDPDMWSLVARDGSLYADTTLVAYTSDRSNGTTKILPFENTTTAKPVQLAGSGIGWTSQ